MPADWAMCSRLGATSGGTADRLATSAIHPPPSFRAALLDDLGDHARADRAAAFTMLTTEPGPDIAPYHDRQIACCRVSPAWIG